MKDKVSINIPQFSLKLSYILPIAIILFLGFMTVKQWSSTKRFRVENKELRGVNKELLTDYTKIANRVNADSLLVVKKQIQIDSLISLDKQHLRQLYNVNRKYEKLKTDYSSSTDDGKNELFSNLINNLP